MMNPEIKAQWIADLRSGEFEQGQNWLNADGKLCCLGVLCEQAVKAGVIESREGDGIVFYDDKEDIPSETVRAWAGLAPLGDDNQSPGNPKVTVAGSAVRLAELNDGERGYTPRTFGQIADLIEAQL